MAKKRYRVDFGNVTLGDGTARVGIKLSRALTTLEEADGHFCSRRLTGEIMVLKEGEDPTQKTIANDVRHTVKGVFDVKSFLVKTEYLSFGLAFSIQDINPGELSFFAKKSGMLTIGAVEDLDGADPGPDEGEEEGEEDTEEYNPLSLEEAVS